MPRTRGVLKKSGLDDNQILLTGFPIRQDFLEKKDKNKIRKEWKIPNNKFTIMILMGGAGSQATYEYARKIAAMDIDAHLLICTGRNKSVRRKLRKMHKEDGISVSIIPFTKKISDLMSVSDLLITKAGPGSINEALYMELPLIIDRTGPVLFWEKENINFVLKHGYGDVLKKWRKFKKLIWKYCYNKKYYAQKKRSLRKFKKHDFSANIKKIVAQLCPEV